MTADAPTETIGFDDFLKVDVRVGRIVDAEPFPEARRPAYKLTVDFRRKNRPPRNLGPDHQVLMRTGRSGRPARSRGAR